MGNVVRQNHAVSTIVHDAVIARLTTEADAREAATAAVTPKVEETELLKRQFVANARQVQLQLVRLEKYWWSQGVSEHDIHLMIPDRPPVEGRVEVTPQSLIASALGPVAAPVADEEPTEEA